MPYGKGTYGKKRGRPKKVKEREPTNEELIAQFMEQTI